MLRSRTDIFNSYCDNVIRNKSYFIKQTNEVFKDVDFNELKRIVDDDKCDGTYIHLDEYNKVYNNQQLYDENTYDIHEHIECKLDSSKTIQILNNKGNGLINLVKNIKFNKLIVQYINRVDLVVSGNVISTISPPLINSDNDIFFKYGVTYTDYSSAIEIHISMSDQSDFNDLKILSYNLHSKMVNLTDDLYYNLLEGFVDATLEETFNMYKIIIINATSYKYSCMILNMK